MKLKNINVTTIKVLFFLEDADIDNVKVCNKIYSYEKNYTLLVTCMFLKLSHYT